ncbi:MAG: RIO1 family regulatory kinase/ATPase [Euryarchaeota archaeon]|nr:RIO1 family regulatory kinase/ATPase [Euryarchaeota archaeon]
MSLSAEDVRSLHKYDIRILLALERLMKKYRWVPQDILKQSTALSLSELEYRLGHLMGLDMVKSSSVPYKGYQIVFAGYDALALHSLTKRGSVQALGSFLGIGKEALVYEALGMGLLALKFHRVGQRSFQSVRKNRGYMPEYKHFPWIFASVYSAKQEYDALKILYENGVSVPIPVDINRNVVVMSLIQGVNLNQCTLGNPEETLDLILDNVAKAYHLGFIHGDLSEFNVMVDEDCVWIIDWPQWIEPGHPNADNILMRDLRNIITYFERKYGIVYLPEDALSRVVG